VGSTGPALTDVHVIAHVTESVAGFKNGVFNLSPTAGFGKSVFLDASNRTSGTAFDGIYEFDFYFYQFTTPSDYSASVTLNGNGSTLPVSRTITTAQLQAMGFPAIVSLVGIEDTTAPALRAINFGPVPVNTLTGPKIVTVTVRITDAETGFDHGDFLFVAPPCAREPDGESKGAHIDASNRISGDAHDGIYQFDVFFPQFEVDGPWSIDFYLQDQVGNNQTLLSPQIEGLGPAYIPIIGSACVQSRGTLLINTVCSDENPAHGLGGVTINVTDPAGVTTLVTTDDMGMYGVMGALGTYTISAPTTADGHLLNDTPTQTIELTAGGASITYHYIGATISGKVYLDKNHDNLYTAADGDVLLGGIPVQLFDATGMVPVVDDHGNVVSTTTAANGTYAFGAICLAAGTYMVCVPSTVNNAQTGGQTATAVAACQTVTVTAGGTVPNVDFLYNKPICASATSSIASNFNGTAIAAGNNIWFNAAFKASNVKKVGKTTIRVINQSIVFTVGGVKTTITVPDSTIVIDSAATTATSTFSGGAWVMSVPTNTSGNLFLGGTAYKVPAGGLPGGINPVTWTGTFITDTPGVTLNWQWGAAVYNSQFGSQGLNALGAKAADDNHYGPYANSDHAGTPENAKSPAPIGGARGGGGSNWTGSYSSTASVTPCSN